MSHRVQYTTDGEILQDLKKNGELRPWKPKKLRNMVLADSYKRLGHKYEDRARGCAGFLEFETEVENLAKRLKSAVFCKLPLCPMCQWRKARKKATDVSMVLDECLKPEKFFDKGLKRFLKLVPVFLTLTVLTCTIDELEAAIEKILKAWKSLMNHRDFRRAVKGFFRAIEFTYDRDKFITAKRFRSNPKYYTGRGLKVGGPNPNYDKIHLHIHAVLLVDQWLYFKGSDYLETRDYVALWRSALGADYDPVVDVRAFKGSDKGGLRKSVNEAAKYIMKDSGVLNPRNKASTDRLVAALTDALFKRRLYAYGGIFAKVAREVLKNRPEDDLIHVSEEEPIREDVATFFESYFWSFNYLNYLKITGIVKTDAS